MRATHTDERKHERSLASLYLALLSAKVVNVGGIRSHQIASDHVSTLSR